MNEKPIPDGVKGMLYLGGPGPINIRLSKDGLIFGDGSKPIPPPELDFDTILIGNCKGFVSYPALKVLGRWGIAVGLLGRYGAPLSTFVPYARNDAPLRLAQMRCALDPKLRMRVVRAIIEAKTGQPVPSKYRTVETVRSYEGKLDTEFWRNAGVNRTSGWSGTLNLKATKPVNAAVNFAQGVLAVRCRVLIGKIGLDESVGFLHNPWTDKEAFAYDVQELMRRSVDRVALDFFEEFGEEAFHKDADWVYKVKNEPSKELAHRVIDALLKRVRYDGERVGLEAAVTREIRALGSWFRNPGPELRLESFSALA